MKEFEIFKKKFFWLALILVLVVTALFQWPDNHLHLVFCDVGQGDAALISWQNTQVLVDGGPDASVLNCLGAHMPFWDRKIEMAVLTHPDADHLTGLVDVLERYDVTHLILNSAGKDSRVFRRFQKAVVSEGAVVYFPKKGDVLRFGPVEMAILWPESQGQVLGATTIEKEANETSTVFKLSFGEFDALFTGDITSREEEGLEIGDIEVLKVAHHGSKFSTSKSFLEKITPEAAVISVGKNSFGHPTDEVIQRLKEQSIKLFRTDQEGEMKIVTDGEVWRRF